MGLTMISLIILKMMTETKRPHRHAQRCGQSNCTSNRENYDAFYLCSRINSLPFRENHVLRGCFENFGVNR